MLLDFAKIKAKLKAQDRLRKVLFIDGTDPRAIGAVKRIQAEGVAEPILLIEKSTDAQDQALTYWLLSDILATHGPALAALYVERRKGKETLAQAEAALLDKHVVAMLLLQNDTVDGVVGGLQAPTADILRPAFKVIGPKPGVKTISSVMIMHRSDASYVFGDVSVNIDPDAQQLADIGLTAATLADKLSLKPRVAFLSFSTKGSAQHEKVSRVAAATQIFNETNQLGIRAVGEVQFDAAFSPEVRQAKFGELVYEGAANVYIFPDLNAGNIGYKIAQRLGNMGAIGPIIVGINKPVNDLSRGASEEDVYNTGIITAAQS